MPVTHGVAGSSPVRTAEERGKSNMVNFGFLLLFFIADFSRHPGSRIPGASTQEDKAYIK